ncbi:growth/differentiation factor 8-like isoform X2 [Tubulanus polymorphus]|uniref:growth/differentiation factor 8-like isoform X2 n=1 Tax=Tubulanus polymorphus TaxID=672921 RepID=UPI003DA1FA7E
MQTSTAKLKCNIFSRQTLMQNHVCTVIIHLTLIVSVGYCQVITSNMSGSRNDENNAENTATNQRVRNVEIKLTIDDYDVNYYDKQNEVQYSLGDYEYNYYGEFSRNSSSIPRSERNRQPTAEERERFINISKVINYHLAKQGEAPIKDNCSSCVLREQARLLRIESIKNNILKGLGMTKPPNITGRVLPKVPSLLNAINTYARSDKAPYLDAIPLRRDASWNKENEATLSRVFNVAVKAPHYLSLPDDVIYFTFDDKTAGYDTLRATLYLHLRYSGSNPVKLCLYHMEKRKGARFPSRGEMLKARTIRRKVNSPIASRNNPTGRWIKIDVKASVQKWLSNDDENYGLQALVFDTNDNDVTNNWLHSLKDNDDLDKAYAPTLDMKVRPFQTRNKRDMLGLECDGTDTAEVRCCKYPLTIDFEQFGWDWIQGPKRYRSDFCSGKCPMRFLNDQLHTFLVQAAIPQGATCCTPRKLEPLTLLYASNEGNVVLANLPGMIVVRCGCA